MKGKKPISRELLKAVSEFTDDDDRIPNLFTLVDLDLMCKPIELNPEGLSTDQTIRKWAQKTGFKVVDTWYFESHEAGDAGFWVGLHYAFGQLAINMSETDFDLYFLDISKKKAAP